MTTSQHAPVDVDADISTIESALVTIVRRARLPEAHARLAAATGIELDRAGYAVLNRIAEWQPLRLSDLARRIGVEPPTASVHVKRLQARGFVQRDADPADGRACLLSLTEDGQRIVGEAARYRQQAIAALLADWSQRDRRQLARLLDRLTQQLTADT